MKEEWKIVDSVLKIQDINTNETLNMLEDTAWIISLAQVEENIEKTGVINYDEVNTPEKFLKTASLALLNSLRQKAIILVNIFNSNKAQHSSAIKIYRINNTDADFMIFRNALKLIFSIQRPGIIQVSFNVSSASIYSNLGISNNEKIGDLIQAQLGPFHEAIWTFQGVRVNIDNMLKYYLTKFIQNSVR